MKVAMTVKANFNIILRDGRFLVNDLHVSSSLVINLHVPTVVEVNDPQSQLILSLSIIASFPERFSVFPNTENSVNAAERAPFLFL